MTSCFLQGDVSMGNLPPFPQFKNQALTPIFYDERGLAYPSSLVEGLGLIQK